MRADQILRRFLGPIELIHLAAGPRLLHWTRLGICGLWMFKLLLDPLWRLAELPKELWIPTGLLAGFPASWTEALLTREGLWMLWLGSMLSLVACLVPRVFPVASLCAALLLTIYSSVIRSFGPPVHTDIVLLLAVYALALFSWADAWAVRKGRDPAAFASYPLMTIVALLCGAYFLVGLSRLCVGGIGTFTGETMEVWTIDASLRAYYFNTDLGWHLPEWPYVTLLLRLGFPVITLFEMAAPLCLVWPRFRWVFIPTMLSFHLLSLVLMNIFFFDDMLLYLLLVDWGRRGTGTRLRKGSENEKPAPKRT